MNQFGAGLTLCLDNDTMDVSQVAIVSAGDEAFPLFGQEYKTLYVHKNGFIAFDTSAILSSSSSSSACLSGEDTGPILNAFCQNYSTLIFPATNVSATRPTRTKPTFLRRNFLLLYSATLSYLYNA